MQSASQVPSLPVGGISSKQHRVARANLIFLFIYLFFHFIYAIVFTFHDSIRNTTSDNDLHNWNCRLYCANKLSSFVMWLQTAQGIFIHPRVRTNVSPPIWLQLQRFENPFAHRINIILTKSGRARCLSRMDAAALLWSTPGSHSSSRWRRWGGKVESAAARLAQILYKYLFLMFWYVISLHKMKTGLFTPCVGCRNKACEERNYCRWCGT